LFICSFSGVNQLILPLWATHQILATPGYWKIISMSKISFAVWRISDLSAGFGNGDETLEDAADDIRRAID
jgi:hypothetical protein